MVVFTLPALGAFWFAKRGQRQGVVLGYLLAGVPVSMAILLGAFGMIFNYRHYSFAVPGYLLAVALGWRVCIRSAAGSWTWLAIATLFSVLALRANYAVTKPDYRVGFLPLAASYQPGDCATARPRAWYRQLHLGWEVYYPNQPLRLVRFDSLPDGLTDCQRIWMIWDRTWWLNEDKGAAQEYLHASKSWVKTTRLLNATTIRPSISSC